MSKRRPDFGLSSAIAVALAFFAAFSWRAEASRIRIVTSTPDVAAIVAEVGGDAVSVESLLSGTEDPHFVDATPRFVQLALAADAVCAMGLDLEAGWLPKVLARTGKSTIQPGGAGHCELGSSIDVLEKFDSGSDRSKGDIHASGNPHFNLSPRAIAQSSSAVLDVLIRLRPEQASVFKKNRERFVTAMTHLEASIRQRLKPLIDRSMSSPVAIEYHREFVYFFALYGLKSLGSIEEKPGLQPSAAYLASIANQSRQSRVGVGVASHTAPRKQLARFTELSGIPIKTLYTMLQNSRGAPNGPRTFSEMQEQIASALLNP